MHGGLEARRHLAPDDPRRAPRACSLAERRPSARRVGRGRRGSQSGARRQHAARARFGTGALLAGGRHAGRHRAAGDAGSHARAASGAGPARGLFLLRHDGGTAGGGATAMAGGSVARLGVRAGRAHAGVLAAGERRSVDVADRDAVRARERGDDRRARRRRVAAAVGEYAPAAYAMNRESRVPALALGVMLLGTGCAALSSAPAPPVAPRAGEANRVASPPAEPQRPSEDTARILAELAELQNAVARLIATSRSQDEHVAALERRLTELAERQAQAPDVPLGFAPSGPGAAAPSSAPAPAT